jgi:hypothetical protein
LAKPSVVLGKLFFWGFPCGRIRQASKVSLAMSIPMCTIGLVVSMVSFQLNLAKYGMSAITVPLLKILSEVEDTTDRSVYLWTEIKVSRAPPRLTRSVGLDVLSSKV